MNDQASKQSRQSEINATLDNFTAEANQNIAKIDAQIELLQRERAAFCEILQRINPQLPQPIQGYANQSGGAYPTTSYGQLGAIRVG